MGYYMTIVECSLEAEELPRGLDPDYWTLGEAEDGKTLIFPTEWYFKWGQWFKEDLKTMARAGIKGEIEMYGEQGEWEKYVLKDGVVELYEGRVTYGEAPSETFRDISSFWWLDEKGVQVI